jgi:hypothetical protein
MVRSFELVFGMWVSTIASLVALWVHAALFSKPAWPTLYYLSLPVLFVICFQSFGQPLFLFTKTPSGLFDPAIALLAFLALRSTRTAQARIELWLKRMFLSFTVFSCWEAPYMILAFAPGWYKLRQMDKEDAKLQCWLRDLMRETHPPYNMCFQMVELISTEASYLESLREFEQCILQPIRAAPDQAGLQAEDVKKLVAHFPEIIGLVQSFVDQLGLCRQNRDVAQAFLQFSGHFKMYGALAVEVFGHSPWVRLQGSENLEFQAFVRSALQRTTRQSLDDYLIMPIQRITRYPLLFKNVDEQCFQASEQLARHVNGSMRDIDKTMAVPVFAIDFEKEQLLTENRRLRCVRNYLVCALCIGIAGGVVALMV